MQKIINLDIIKYLSHLAVVQGKWEVYSVGSDWNEPDFILSIPFIVIFVGDNSF